MKLKNKTKPVCKIIGSILFGITLWCMLPVVVKADEDATLKIQNSGEEAYFLGSDIVKKSNIEKLTINNSLQGINETAWDVSSNNSGSIKAWYTDGDNDGLYEVMIGSSTGEVKAHTDSSNLFAYIGKDVDASIEGLQNLDTGNVTDMRIMFRDCKNLTKLDVTGFDTSNVTNMSNMFSGCSNLTELDVTGFNTSNVEDMHWMFDKCNSLTELDVSGFDTSKVTNMGLMFRDCKNLTNLDVSGFDTSNVKNMSWMFLRM